MPELIYVDHGFGLLEFGTELSHLQRLLAVVGEVEGAAKILIGLRQGEVYIRNIDGGAVIEPHSVPPFLWQYSCNVWRFSSSERVCMMP